MPLFALGLAEDHEGVRHDLAQSPGVVAATEEGHLGGGGGWLITVAKS